MTFNVAYMRGDMMAGQYEFLENDENAGCFKEPLRQKKDTSEEFDLGCQQHCQ